jgi:hypothetical protein
MIGNLLAYARLLSIAKKVIHKKDIQHSYSFMIILLLHLLPAMIVVMFYQSNALFFYHLMIIIVLIGTGYRWTKIWSKAMDEFEEQLDHDESEPPFKRGNIDYRPIKEQFIAWIKIRLSSFIEHISSRIFWRKKLIKKLMLETLLFPPSKRVVKIFSETQEQLDIHGVGLFIT